jgi:transposase
MAAYSIDLRTKILSAWQNQEGSQREIAKRFKVSLSFVRDMLRRYRETNEIAALPQGGDRRSKLKIEDQKIVKEMVKENNDIYLREIQAAMQEKMGVEVSISSLSRTLNRLNLRRKKKQIRQQSKQRKE